MHRGECGVHVYPSAVPRPFASLRPYLVVRPTVDPLPERASRVRVRVALDVGGSPIRRGVAAERGGDGD